MEQMSQEGQRRMLKALDKAADYTQDGLSPDAAIIKVAQEFELEAPMIERVCEAYNKANAVAYMRSAPENERAGNYPLAKISSVMGAVYGVGDKQAEESDIKVKDYASAYAKSTDPKRMEKTASAEVFADRPPVVATPQAIRASAEKLLGQMHKLSARTKDNMVKATWNVQKGLEKIAELVEQVPATRAGKKRLEKISMTLSNALGESDAHMLVNAVNAISRDDARAIPTMPKTASAVVIGNDPICMKAVALMEERRKMVAFQEMEKESATIVDPANVASMGAPLQDVLRLPGVLPEPADIHMDITTGKTGEWDAYAKDLNSRRLLYDLMINDPEISMYSPGKVQGMYNEVITTFPELAAREPILRAILRKGLAQGGAFDIYEIKDLLSAGKELSDTSKSQAEARKQTTEASSKSRGGGGSGDTINIPITTS